MSVAKYDPVLWLDPLGRLWFIWNVMPGEQVMASICNDPDADDLIRGEEFCIGRGIMMNKPIVLSGGEWLFPADQVSEEYAKTIRAPLSDAKLIAVGGVSADNASEFFRMGFCGIGIGSNLYDKKLIEEKKIDELRALAGQYSRVSKTEE